MFSLTVFKSIFDNDTSTRVDFDTFEEFEKALYHLATMPGYKPKKGESTKRASPLISPACYKAGTTRANANVTEWGQWAALDVDNHQFEGDLKNELVTRYSDYTFICYSTASSSRDHPKFRLVFPLRNRVAAKDIKHFWYALNRKFERMGDEQTKDLSRMYYVPAVYPDAHNFIFTHHANFLDVDSLLAEYPYEEKKNSDNFFDRLPEDLQKEVIKHRQNKLNETKRDVTWTSYRDCPFVNQNLIQEYKRISSIDGSGRYSMIYKIMTSIACNAIKKKYPISEYEITELVLQLDRDTANRYQKRPLKVEAGRALEFAYKNALTSA